MDKYRIQTPWERKRRAKQDWGNAILIALGSISGGILFIVGFLELLSACGLI